jgi:hypothetical protein
MLQGTSRSEVKGILGPASPSPPAISSLSAFQAQPGDSLYLTATPVFLASSLPSCFLQLSLGGPKKQPFVFILFFIVFSFSSDVLLDLSFSQLLAQVTLFKF